MRQALIADCNLQERSLAEAAFLREGDTTEALAEASSQVDGNGHRARSATHRSFTREPLRGEFTAISG